MLIRAGAAVAWSRSGAGTLVHPPAEDVRGQYRAIVPQDHQREQLFRERPGAPGAARQQRRRRRVQDHEVGLLARELPALEDLVGHFGTLRLLAGLRAVYESAKLKDAGQRNDLEAGMAKYLASEYCSQVVEDSFRIHGGYGYSKEYEIERLYREAPMLLIGEGTADIQRMIIARRLLEEYKSKG